MDKVKKQSDSVISSNVEWLLKSGIRIKDGDDKGALYGWKYLNLNILPIRVLLKLRDMQ